VRQDHAIARNPGMRLDVNAARRLGTGLSRVVAHELVHALVPALPHGKGLMAARLDRRMLTGPGVPVGADVGAYLPDAGPDSTCGSPRRFRSGSAGSVRFASTW
jgi:hypothetical protein